MTEVAQSAKKKGLHPLAWVGIGCGTIVILGIVATIVLGAMGIGFLKKKAEEFETTGITMTTEEGTMVLGGSAGLEKMPKWFEMPDGITGGRSLMHMEENGRKSGQVQVESSLPPSDLGVAFEQSLQAAGFVQRNKMETGQMISYSFETEDGNRSVNITITAQTGQTKVMINYNEQ